MATRSINSKYSHIYSLVHLFIYPFIYSLITYSFMNPSIHPSNHSFSIYPFLCLFILTALTLGCHFLTIFFTALLKASGYDILPLDISRLPMQLDTDDIKLQGDAWKFAATDPRVTWSFANPVDEKESLRSSRYDILEVYYQDKQNANENVITAENLKKIRDFEENLYNNSVYQKELCLLENKKCQKPFSIIRLFDGTYKHLHPVFYDPDFKNIAAVVHQANMFMPTIRYHFSKDVEITPIKATSSAIRSMFFTGNPFEGKSMIGASHLLRSGTRYGYNWLLGYNR